ncbi:MAG: DNA polymerase III subunit alpha [Nakamurella sp.]
MTGNTYVNLHTHSAHSAKDGLSKLDELCKAVAADEQTAVAVTDHGIVSGAWKLAAAAKKTGIKPIMGMEAYLAIGSRFEENSRRIPRNALDADGSDFGSGAAGFKDQDYEHLTLLAANRTGWRNLAQMSTESSDSFWKKPRLDYEQLSERSEGIIALTGCISGPVAGALLRDGLPDEKGRIFDGQRAARDALSKLIDVFGRDQVNVEIMEHGIPVEQKITTQLLELAKEFKLPAVATNDSHYTDSQDRLAHDMWLCIGQSSTKRTFRISDTDRWSFTGSGYHLRSYVEMVEALSPYGKAGLAALHRTNEIADGIEADVLPASKLRLPEFPAPDGFDSSDAYFKHLVFEGADRRYGEGWQQRHPEVRARLNREVRTIRRMGFIDYFLIVHDIVTWARRGGVRVGPGRGSAAGSCVSYCLGIVAIEPISTGLLFERFLDETREEMPDIDLDFDTAGQPRVFAYIAQRWGADVVARLGTFGFARARKAIKDSARAIFPPEISGKLGSSMAKLVPGIHTTISEIMDPKFTAGAPLRDLIAADEDARTVIDAAATIEGVIFNESVHACGVVIATEPLTEIGIPLRRDRRKGRGGAWVTQWDGKDITALGLTKLDILGLRNLDTVNHAVHQIEKTTGELIDPEVLPTDSSDPRVRKVWSLLADGNTTGVFQLLSSGMTKLCQQVRPESLEDISALVALFRPGPLGAGFHEIFARRKNGEEAVDYGIFTSDPDEQEVIESVLGTTYGVVVYQEQAMQIGAVVAGFGASENNRLRRAISKKNGAEMVAVGELFITGAATDINDEDGNLVKRAFAESTAARLWDSMKSAGEYMFNKCLTGDTVLQTASHHTWTIAELHRKLTTIDTAGPNCGWCQNRPSRIRGLCPGCYTWHTKFRNRGLTLLAFDFADDRIRPKRVKDVHYNGVKPVFRVTLADGKSLTGTSNHRLLTPTGWMEIGDLRTGNSLIVDGGYEVHQYTPAEYRVTSGQRRGVGRLYARGEGNISYIDGGHVALMEWTNETASEAACGRDGQHSGRLERAHLDGDRTNNAASNLEWMCVSHHKQHDYRNNGRSRRWEKGHVADESAIVSIQYAGEEPTFDVEMDDQCHNFTANGIVSHNSHSYAYGYLAYVTAYMKANWPHQFAAATLASDNDDDRRAASLTQMRKDGIRILGPSVNSSELVTTCGKDLIVRLGLGEIKGLGSEAAAAIIADRDLRGVFAPVDTYGMKHSALGTMIARVQVPSSEEGGDPRSLTNAEVQALIESGAVDELCGGRRKGQLAVAHCLRVHPDVEPFDSEFPVIVRAALERYRLGVLLSQNPLLTLRDQVLTWRDSTGTKPAPLHKLSDDDNAQVLTLGVITALNAGTYGGGQKLGIIVEGSTMSMPGIAFDSTVQRLIRERKMPRLGDIVAVRGRVRIVDVPVNTGGSEDDEPIDGVENAEVVEEKVRRKELMVHDLTTLPLEDEGELPTVARGAKIMDLFNRGAEIVLDEQSALGSAADSGSAESSSKAQPPQPAKVRSAATQEATAPTRTSTSGISTSGTVTCSTVEGGVPAAGVGAAAKITEQVSTEQVSADREDPDAENTDTGRAQPLFVVILPVGGRLHGSCRMEKAAICRTPVFRRLLAECARQIEALPAGSVVRVEGEHGRGELVVLVAPAGTAAGTRTAQVDERPESLAQLLSAAGLSAVELTGKARLTELTMLAGKKATLVARRSRASQEVESDESAVA